MKPVLVFALFSAAATYGEELRPAPPVPTIAVFLSFDNHPSELSVEAMKQEADAVLHTAGLALDWRPLEDNRGDEPADDVAVLRFKGTCQPKSILPHDVAPQLDRIVLASTRISDGYVLPFSDVECDQIREYIAPVETGTFPQRECILGRVLGRIVAHELFHLLARTTKHFHSGPTESAHTAREFALKDFDFSFSARDSELLRHR
jgi:hypothetical protein